jgi:hypothetical protein
MKRSRRAGPTLHQNQPRRLAYRHRSLALSIQMLSRSILLIAPIVMIAGCSSAITNDVVPSKTLTDCIGEWRKSGNEDCSLYIGEKRWCLFDRDPDKSWIEGSVATSASNTTLLPLVTLLETSDQYDVLGNDSADFDGLQVYLHRIGNKLQIISKTESSPLDGVYSYAGDWSPNKGLDIHQWGSR